MNCATYVFPAIKGIQAQREYYASMVSLDVISNIFQFSDEELSPEIRAQRILNKTRIPEIRDYMLDNLDSYVFSALTVSVDGDMEFKPLSTEESQIGTINIAMSARFLINDGQHRQAAIAEAIKLNPSLKNEHISVVFYRDEGLLRSQQMFSDLNRYAIKPTKSINILFDSRAEPAIIAKRVIDEVEIFKGLVERERSNKDLLAMYSGASADGECPLVLDTSTPSCGNSRFGCWVCTMVAEDKSMAAMIQNDEEKSWMLPMLEFRNYMAGDGNWQKDRDRRDFRRRDGHLQYYNNRLVHGPYTKKTREDFLRRLLKLEQLVHEIGPDEIKNVPLITMEELKFIRHLWLDEFHEFDDSLPRIYEEVTGKKCTSIVHGYFDEV